MGTRNPVLDDLRTAIISAGGIAADPPPPVPATPPEVAKTAPDQSPAPPTADRVSTAAQSQSTATSRLQYEGPYQEVPPPPIWVRPANLRPGDIWVGPVVGDTYKVLTVLGDVFHDVTSARLSTVIGREAADAVAHRLAGASGTGAEPIIVDSSGLALKRLATGRVVYLEDIPRDEWFGAPPPPASPATRRLAGDLSRVVHAHLRAQVQRVGGTPADMPASSAHAAALVSCGLDASAAETYIMRCIASSSTGVALPPLRAPASANGIRPPE